MKKLIVVSSRTGNTLKVANAIYEELSECDLVKTEKLLSLDNSKINTDDYDVIIAGFWLDAGHIDDFSEQFIPSVKNKKVILFGTLGGDPKSDGANVIMDRTIESLDKSCILLGHFWIQGKIALDVIELMYSHQPDLKDNKEHQERLKRASSHPDENDLKKAVGLVRKLLGE